jgi:hypothetical protein
MCLAHDTLSQGYSVSLSSLLSLIILLRNNHLLQGARLLLFLFFFQIFKWLNNTIQKGFKKGGKFENCDRKTSNSVGVCIIIESHKTKKQKQKQLADIFEEKKKKKSRRGWNLYDRGRAHNACRRKRL